MERETGIEPATFSLGRRHSTTELLSQYVVLKYEPLLKKQPNYTAIIQNNFMGIDKLILLMQHKIMSDEIASITVNEADMELEEAQRDERVGTLTSDVFHLATSCLVEGGKVTESSLDRVSDICFDAVIKGANSDEALALAEYRRWMGGLLASDLGVEAVKNCGKQGVMTALNNPEFLPVYARRHGLIAVEEIATRAL